MLPVIEDQDIRLGGEPDEALHLAPAPLLAQPVGKGAELLGDVLTYLDALVPRH